MCSKICFGAVIFALSIVGGAGAPSANGAPPDDACSLLTPAQVSAVANVSVGAGQSAGTSKKVCTWTATSPAEKSVRWVTLMLQSVEGYQGGKQMGQMKNATVTAVSGVGDEAYYLAVATNVGLIVKKGNAAFKVAVYADIPIEKKEEMEKTLAQQVVSNL